MRFIRLPLFITLLTFAVGAASVFIWRLQQDNSPEVTAVFLDGYNEAEGIDEFASDARAKKISIVVPKYVYISDPLKLLDELGEKSIDSADLVIFYENGVWARSGVSVEAAPKGRLQITSEGHHGYLELGRWQKHGGGKIIVSVDKCFCSSESIMVTTLPNGEEIYGGGTLELPIEENWQGLLGHERMVIKSPARQRFRLLTQREWSNDTNGEILFAPFERRAKDFGRDCYREDRYWAE